MTWERVDDERGAHVPEYVETRVCAYEPCGTILSRHNRGTHCSIHEGLDVRAMCLSPGTQLEDEAKKISASKERVEASLIRHSRERT